MLKFNWTATSFTGPWLMLKLEFDNPLYISSGAQYDTLMVKFLKPSLFRDGKNSLSQQYTSCLMSKQMPPGNTTENFMSASEQTQTIMNYMLYASIGLKILVHGTGAVKYMIGMLNSLQLVIHLPMLSIIFPTNTCFFFRLILPIVMFDLLENNNPISQLFPFDQA